MQTNDKAMEAKHAPVSSLAAALHKAHPSNGFNSVKKVPDKCRFHANRDKCRFVHSRVKINFELQY
jgi:hypothetical protein